MPTYRTVGAHLCLLPVRFLEMSIVLRHVVYFGMSGLQIRYASSMRERQSLTTAVSQDTTRGGGASIGCFGWGIQHRSSWSLLQCVSPFSDVIARIRMQQCVSGSIGTLGGLYHSWKNRSDWRMSPRNQAVISDTNCPRVRALCLDARVSHSECLATRKP